MRILVCYKIVPDEQDITVNSDRTLNLSRAELKIGPYDLNAVEAGARLAEDTGGTLTALTAGGDEAESSKMKKSILSRGCAQNYVVKDPGLAGADSGIISAALAQAAQKLDWDLILCGEGSSDLYAQQVGVQLGERLGVPTINGVNIITPDGDRVLVERSLEEETELLSVPLPAVLSVTAECNVTRVPSMKEILGAGKKPTTVWTGNDVDLPMGETVKTLSVLAPAETQRKRVLIEGDSEDKIAEFCRAIRTELE